VKKVARAGNIIYLTETLKLHVHTLNISADFALANFSMTDFEIDRNTYKTTFMSRFVFLLSFYWQMTLSLSVVCALA